MRKLRFVGLALATAVGIVLAAPALVLGQGRGSIGIQVQDVDTGQGAEVREVVPDSPAARAGFSPGDVVIEFDGERVRSAQQLSRLVQETAPGREVAAVVTRSGQRHTLQVTTEQRRGTLGLPGVLRDDLRAFPGDRLFEMPLPRMGPGRSLGTTLLPLNDQLAGYFGVKQGVLVSSVAADSAAARAGLRAGDVIVAVDGRIVRDPGEVRDAMRARASSGAVELRVVREKRDETIRIPAVR